MRRMIHLKVERDPRRDLEHQTISICRLIVVAATKGTPALHMESTHAGRFYDGTNRISPS